MLRKKETAKTSKTASCSSVWRVKPRAIDRYTNGASYNRWSQHTSVLYTELNTLKAIKFYNVKCVSLWYRKEDKSIVHHISSLKGSVNYPQLCAKYCKTHLLIARTLSPTFTVKQTGTQTTFWQGRGKGDQKFCWAKKRKLRSFCEASKALRSLLSTHTWHKSSVPFSIQKNMFV